MVNHWSLWSKPVMSNATFIQWKKQPGLNTSPLLISPIAARLVLSERGDPSRLLKLWSKEVTIEVTLGSGKGEKEHCVLYTSQRPDRYRGLHCTQMKWCRTVQSLLMYSHSCLEGTPWSASSGPSSTVWSVYLLILTYIIYTYVFTQCAPTTTPATISIIKHSYYFSDSVNKHEVLKDISLCTSIYCSFY